MRKASYYIIFVLLGVSLLFACSSPQSAVPAETPTPSASVLVETTPVMPSATTPQNRPVTQMLMGFIVPDTNELSIYTLKHGFLRTAETLGYPAKLYLANTAQAAQRMVEEAALDGCSGLLIYNENHINDAAIARAAELGMPVVIPYHETACPGTVTNVVADVDGYSEEVALGVAERMVERSCKSGRILVYGKAPDEMTFLFQEAIASYYPQFNVASFTRTKLTEQEAIDELSEILLWNRDIKGMFCMDTDGALIAVRAREKADAAFRSGGAPEKKPTLTPPPNTLPVGPTPVPEGLLTQVLISVAGYGLTEDAVSLMRNNDIYAFVLEPYYEASAQSLMLLDRILNGETVPASSTLNMPIVRMTSLEKYVQIHEQVQDWFGLISSEER